MRGAGCSEVHIVYLRLPEFSAFIPSNPSPRTTKRTCMPFIEWLMKDEMCLLTFLVNRLSIKKVILKVATRFISRFLSEKFVSTPIHSNDTCHVFDSSFNCFW